MSERRQRSHQEDRLKADARPLYTLRLGFPG